MNRELLKEVIQNIVAQKLAEIKANDNRYGKSKSNKYGYIIANKDTQDPTLQLIGYGNMPSSSWKKRIIEDLQALMDDVKNDDWRNASSKVATNGVLQSSINMMKEVYVKDLNELGLTTGAKESIPQNPADVKKQKELADLKKKQSDLNDGVRELDARKQKLEDPIRRQVQDIERKKAPEVKKLGAITKQIQDLENK